LRPIPKNTEKKMKLHKKQETTYNVLTDVLPDGELYAAGQIRLKGQSVDDITGEVRDFEVFRERGQAVNKAGVEELRALLESGSVIEPDSVRLSNLRREGFDSSLTSMYYCKVSAPQEKVNLLCFADNIREAIDKFDDFCSLYFPGAYVPQSIKVVKAKYIYDLEAACGLATSANFMDTAPDIELRMISVKLEVVSEGPDGKSYKNIRDYVIETDTAEKAVDIAKRDAEEDIDTTDITVKSTKVDEGIFVE